MANPKLTPLCVVGLHRAVVAVTDLYASRRDAVRIVFFETWPGTDPAMHLQRLLAAVWAVDTDGWCENGVFYSLCSAQELAQQCQGGQPDDEGLYLFEMGASGDQGIGASHVHYARAEDVDLLVPPRLAPRLQRALRRIEALHAEQDIATGDSAS